MKTLNKFFKTILFIQATGARDNALQEQLSKTTRIKGQLFSNDSKSLLHIINNKDNEFLFI